MQTQNYEQTKQPKVFNPNALQTIASAGESVTFEVVEVGDEQCVVASVADLVDDMKHIFDGSPTYIAFDGSEKANPIDGDSSARAEWREWQSSLLSDAGDAGIEVQFAKTGETGRRKTLQVALFDLHNTSELMTSLQDLNKSRKADGAERLDGVPDEYAYLPEALVRATTELRAGSVEAHRNLAAAQRAAIHAGALATSSF